MPFITLKRDDVPTGTLQVLDLKPNESQRNLIYETPGQTKYVNPHQNETPVLVTVGPDEVVQDEVRGLSALMLMCCSDGVLVSATGTLTVAGPLIGPPGLPYIDVAGFPLSAILGPRAPGSLDFDVSSGVPATIAADIIAAISDVAGPWFGLGLATAAPGAPGDVVITAGPASPGSTGNTVTFGPVIPDPAFLFAPPTGFLAGGSDGAPLTAATAVTKAQDVLDDIVRYGDLTAPALDADLASVNAALAPSVLSAASHQFMLRILAGEEFVVPAGNIQSTGGALAPDPPITDANFTAGTNRTTYDTDSLLLSANTGHLSILLRNSFEVGGVGGTNGEAIIVYNDDGTLF